MKKTLIIVDVQYDFYHPNGSLYVKGGENIIPHIADYIHKHKDEISDVVFTLDWHPNVPAAFTENEGVKWPNHCVQYTVGAGVSDHLFNACNDINKMPKFFLKGNTVPHTEYGAFEQIHLYNTINNQEKIGVSNRVGDSHLVFDTRNVVVCGIAGDYCVLQTLTNLIESGLCQSIEVLENGVVSIDGTNEKLKDFCKANNVKLI